MLLAAVRIIIQKKDKLAGLLLGIMLIIFVIAFHIHTVMGGDQMAMVSELKDLALAGAAFTYGGLAKN